MSTEPDHPLVARVLATYDTAAPLDTASSRRERLHHRREHETFPVMYRGRTFTAGVGRFDDGRVAELFIDAAKSGEDMQAIARDAAVVASLALQYGCPLDTMRAALTRDERGQAAGPLGALLDRLVDMDGGAR